MREEPPLEPPLRSMQRNQYDIRDSVVVVFITQVAC